MNQLIKPANCTCQFPDIVARNMSGHDESCPAYIEWYDRVFPAKPFKPQPCFATDSKEVSIKEFVESGALDEVNRVLSARGLKLDFHKIGNVFSNAVSITRAN